MRHFWPHASKLAAAFVALALPVLGGAAVAAAQAPPTIEYIRPLKIAKGDTITIIGSSLMKADTLTTVMIDGQLTGQVVLVSADSVKAVVDTDSRKGSGRVGEYNREVVVVVGDNRTLPHMVRQFTWEVILRPRVLLPLAIALLAILLVSVNANFSVFKSQTGKPSLSKIQMALWTITFGLSYVVLAAIWGEFLDITEGMFWLMGISVTTAAGAKAIVVKNVANLDKANPSGLLSDYSTSFTITEASLKRLKSLPEDVFEQLKTIREREYVDEKTFVAALEALSVADTHKPIILKEAAVGYRLSLHRCQIALWTLIIFAIYVVKLLSTMHLPDIPNNLLVLMGVSGGAYLGFNYPKTPAK
jgi:hypothetical protein